MNNYINLIKKYPFGSCLLFATIFHIIFIFGISFSKIQAQTKKNDTTKTVNITLVTKKTDLIDPNTNTFAQENNIGGGEKKDKKSNRTLLNEDSNVTKIEVEEKIAMPIERKQTKEEHIITTTGDSSFKINSKELKDRENVDSMDSIHQELSLYQKALKSIPGITDTIADDKSFSERVLRLTSTTARKKAGVRYQENWRIKVERIGNQFYPSAASQNKIYGNLRMLVIIRRDGSLEEARILSSSGHKVLDDYALRVVRMAAPYAKFDSELKEYDKIELIRTWKFDKSSLKHY